MQPSARDVVVIGASSGGVEALMRIAGGLPSGLPASVFVAVHFPQGAPSALPRILSRSGPLPAAHPEDGEPIRRGRVYVAPPDRHLLLEDGRVRVVRGPKENRHRPAVDPLFRSAAVARGPRVVGVVLTGSGNDGTSGLISVKARGGVAVVQDPDDALFPWMPASALEFVEVDHSVALEKIAPLIARLADEPAREEGGYPVPEGMEYEAKVAKLDPIVEERDPPGELSSFTCPECTGPLYEQQENGFVRYRCRVGHAYTAESMLEEKGEALEDALYVAFNTLQESAAISDRLAARARGSGHAHAARRFGERAREARQKAEEIRRVLTDEANEAQPNAE